MLFLLVLQHGLKLLVLLASIAPALILLLTDVFFMLCLLETALVLMIRLLLTNVTFVLSGLILALCLVTCLPGLLFAVVALVHVLNPLTNLAHFFLKFGRQPVDLV